MQTSSRSAARSIVVAILTALTALVIGVMQTLTTAVTAAIGLSAVQAIIVPGTGTQHPAQVADYLPNVVDNYRVPGGECRTQSADNDCVLVPQDGIEYDAQFWPIPLPGWGGLQGAKWNDSVHSGVVAVNAALAQTDPNQPIVVFGYSQGATVAGLIKKEQAGVPGITYFFIGNPQRPNGGVFERLAFLGTVPILDATFGNPTPTNTCPVASGDHCATDVALQYDGVVDSPQWLLNPFAVGNALAGFAYVHGTYLSPDDGEPSTAHPYGYTVDEVQTAIAAAEANCDETTHCQKHGDTVYVTLPARTLPLYQPLLDIGSATGTSALIIPIVDLVQPATQTLIETGYNRSDYGDPQPGTLLPPAGFNPLQTAGDLAKDIPLGINNALTPGLQPLPGSSDSNVVETNSPTVTTTVTNQMVSTSTVADTNPLLRLSTIAKPGEGASNSAGSGSSANRPLGSALNDFHPVRDGVKAVSGTVKKALGQDDAAAKADAPN
jgi:hypothetical protein